MLENLLQKEVTLSTKKQKYLKKAVGSKKPWASKIENRAKGQIMSAMEGYKNKTLNGNTTEKEERSK